jgi:hypothetical protein
MKRTTVILLMFLGYTTLGAQETIARFKYEDAEKAFVAGNYQECIDNLDEAEKLLGKTAPNILHLKILAQYKFFEQDPYRSYEALETLRHNCSTYLSNYDISGVEEKYRDVYDLGNQLVEFPSSREEFDNVIKNVFLKYIEAIGGRKTLEKIESIFISGHVKQEKVGSWQYEERKIHGKSALSFFDEKKRKITTKWVNTAQTPFVYYTGGKRNKRILEHDMEGMLEGQLMKSLFPVLEWIGLLEDSHYTFALKPNQGKDKNLIQIIVTYQDESLPYLVVVYSFFNPETYLLTGQNTVYYPKDIDWQIQKEDYLALTKISYSNYLDVGGALLPMNKYVEQYRLGQNQKKHIKSIYKYTASKIILNASVEVSDFE